MKVPDMVHMPEDTYFNITDPWRMDWEKGVQVPVQQEQKFKSLKWLVCAFEFTFSFSIQHT